LDAAWQSRPGFWNDALAISPALLLVRVNLAEALCTPVAPEEALRLRCEKRWNLIPHFSRREIF